MTSARQSPPTGIPLSLPLTSRSRHWALLHTAFSTKAAIAGWELSGGWLARFGRFISRLSSRFTVNSEAF